MFMILLPDTESVATNSELMVWKTERKDLCKTDYVGVGWGSKNLHPLKLVNSYFLKSCCMPSTVLNAGVLGMQTKLGKVKVRNNSNKKRRGPYQQDPCPAALTSQSDRGRDGL